MNNKLLLLSIVCYNNIDEVISFVEQIAKQTMSSNIVLGIFCAKKDNKQLDEILRSINVNYYLVDTYENQGYLNNCLNVIKEYKDEYDWAVITNTDIEYYNDDFYEKVLNYKINNDIWEIGTKIINNKDNRQTNPLIIARPSKKFMEIKKTIFTNLALYLLYNIFYQFKKNRKNDNANIKTCEVYAVHGSHFILKKDCINELNKISKNIFMYGEEELIAGLIHKNNKKVLYIEDYSIKHNANSTTNLISSINKFKMYKQSYNFIYNSFFK